MKKLLLLLFLMISLISCFNSSRIHLNSINVLRLKMVSLNSAILSLDLDIYNGTKKLEINDIDLYLQLNTEKLGKISISEPFILNRGNNRSTIELKGTISVNPMKFYVLLDRLHSNLDSVMLSGFVRVKISGITKKVRINNISLTDLGLKDGLLNIPKV